MHNESRADQIVEEPIVKTSKMQKLKNAAPAVAFYGGMAVLTVVPGYYSLRIMKMNLDTAKLQLEAAKTAAEQS